MRGLTAVQKKALKKAVKNYFEKTGVYPVEANELEEFEAIEALNPTEVFWQNANRYVWDLRFTEEFNYMFTGDR